MQKELILCDFIVKIKIKGSGIQNILYSNIVNSDNQKHPDEIYIEKENEEIDYSGETYYLDLEDEESLIIMKWHNYPNSTRWMFKNCDNITEIDLTQFNLTSITSMGDMFLNCKNLIIIKFGNYNTSSLENIKGLFNGCQSLISIDLSMFYTSNVVDMGLMFFYCISLRH